MDSLTTQRDSNLESGTDVILRLSRHLFAICDGLNVRTEKILRRERAASKHEQSKTSTEELAAASIKSAVDEKPTKREATQYDIQAFAVNVQRRTLGGAHGAADLDWRITRLKAIIAKVKELKEELAEREAACTKREQAVANKRREDPDSDGESVEPEATMDELKADEEHNAKMHALGLRLPDPTDEDHLEYSDDSD
ncbi:hypothetical protein LTR56_010007 [Elasticomyces elasticus]|nr:hypothetical protein LTR56_010007 [Elasticomyces elasticus]KAK3665055.1 hypothetical protein LTR22_004111 [Elasticomyces elasticus]KAK4931570.1 hypothetical protein LTR49_001958 [Elasticomyces elasticus]KAK5766730.1 hypothetical protein LTS12_003079 [Elasticomyces elasticus]